jgi:hypothetical protein
MESLVVRNSMRIVAQMASDNLERWLVRVTGCFLGIILLVLAAGCTTPQNTKLVPSGKTGSIRRENGKATKQMSAAVLTAEVSRFADECTLLVAQTADTFADQVGTPQARATALEVKTGIANAMMIIASGPNPTANLLDMVVVVTLGRMTCEEYWIPRYGKPAEPILAVFRELDGEIWSVAGQVLTRPQQDELRELIREWRRRHPNQIYISVRFRDFAEIAVAQHARPNTTLGSLFSLSFLDPFSGLDPTTRELAQTRFFAERALYVLERMPKLLRWQSEAVVAKTLAAPEVLQLVTNSTSFAQSADRLTKAVREFPEQFAAEREQILKGMEKQTPELRALSTQLEQTFEAGNEMAKSVDAAVKSLDGFVSEVTRRPSAPPPAGQLETNLVAAAGKPFDVAEYGAAAAEIAKAAQQLDTLTHSLDKTTPQMKEVVQHAGLQGKELVDYAFHKALLLLVVALVGVVTAVLACRWLTPRDRRAPSADSAGKT